MRLQTIPSEGMKMGRIRLDREERKKQIRDVTVELITEKGFGKTSVQDIINSASISKGCFYHYYSNKEELFKEILDDTMQYRKNLILDYIAKHKDMQRRELVVELLLDKMLDYNHYKKMFVKLLTEMTNDEKLFKLYNELDENLMKDFIVFCKEEGLNEYIKIASDEFNLLITSIIMGATTFGYLGNDKLKDLLREIFFAYFDKIDLFGGE